MRGQVDKAIDLALTSLVVLVILTVSQQIGGQESYGGAAPSGNASQGLTCDQISTQRDYYRNQTRQLRTNVSDLEGNLTECRNRIEELNNDLNMLKERYSDKSVTVQYGGFDFEMRNWTFLGTVLVLGGSIVLRQIMPNSWIGFDGLITIDEKLLKKAYNKLSSIYSKIFGRFYSSSTSD